MIFNVRYNLSACCAHGDEMEVLEESSEKRSFSLSRPAVRPTVALAVYYQRSVLTTELRVVSEQIP